MTEIIDDSVDQNAVATGSHSDISPAQVVVMINASVTLETYLML